MILAQTSHSCLISNHDTAKDSIRGLEAFILHLVTLISLKLVLLDSKQRIYKGQKTPQDNIHIYI